MSTAGAALVAGLVAYTALLASLVFVGRRSRAVALVRLLPDLVVLLRGLARDPRVPRRHRAALLIVAAYIASPIDLVPDFVPSAGKLDDAVLATLVLRRVLRSRGRALVRELWPGPPETRALIERLVSVR